MIYFVRAGRRLAAIMLAAVVGVIALTAAAPVPSWDGSVNSLTFQQRIGENVSATVEVTFDAPIDARRAAELRRTLGAQPVVDSLKVERLRCHQNLERSDRNGGWSLQYTCLPQYAILNWHYQLAPATRATVVGTVGERGLSWWRNGVEQAQNGPHPAAWPNYIFHGTMQKVWNGDVVDYQDYLTWRHNIGPGGRAAVTFAGSVGLG